MANFMEGYSMIVDNSLAPEIVHMWPNLRKWFQITHEI